MARTKTVAKMIEVPIKGQKVKAIQIVEDSTLQFIYQDKLFLTTLKGKVIKVRPVDTQVIIYFKSDDICHDPCFFLDNGRKCDGCKHMAFCQCFYNKFSLLRKEIPNEEEKPEDPGTQETDKEIKTDPIEEIAEIKEEVDNVQNVKESVLPDDVPVVPV